MSRIEDVTAFVKTAKYSVINTLFNNFEIKQQQQCKGVELVPSTYGNKIWVHNQELIFIDKYSRRSEWLFKIDGDFTTDLGATKFLNNLIDNIESFNTRNTLYTMEASTNLDTPYSRPSDMIFILLFQQGTITYNYITTHYIVKLKLRIEFSST